MRCSPQHFAQGAPHFRNPFSLVCFTHFPSLSAAYVVVIGHALPPPALCLLRMSHFTQQPRPPRDGARRQLEHRIGRNESHMARRSIAQETETVADYLSSSRYAYCRLTDAKEEGSVFMAMFV